MNNGTLFKQSLQLQGALAATDCEFIRNFVKTSHNVSIAVLLSCLYRLQMVLLDQSFFLFEDIRRTVEEVVQSKYAATIATRARKETAVRAEETEVETEDLNTFEDDKRDEGRNGDIEGEAQWREGEREVSGEGEGVEQVMVVFYTGLVYELCVTPRMSMEGPRLGLLPPFDEAAVSEERLVQWLLQRLVDRNEKEEGRYELLMDGMRLEAKKYEVSKVVETGEQRETTDDHYPYEDAYQSKPIAQPNANPIYTSTDPHVWSTVADPNDNLAPNSTLASTTAIERHDAVVRLLAHIRKSGMDIVFPQNLHDRMLLIFYMSAKCAAPLAHRELMDMILAVQRTRILGEELEMVSKTKVRGILALLKNAHALLATAGQGDSVRLYLGKAVTTFRMFREKHDAFINRCILQQHMFLPLTVKVEVLWQGSDEQSIMDRCDALREFEPLIEDFIMKGQSQSQNRNHYHGLSGTDVASPLIRDREQQFQPDLRYNIDSLYAPRPSSSASLYSATPQIHQHMQTNRNYGLSGKTQTHSHNYPRQMMLHLPSAEDRAMVMGFSSTFSGSGSHWTSPDTILKGIPHRSGSSMSDINYQGRSDRNSYEVSTNRTDPMSLGWSDRNSLPPSTTSLSHARLPSTDRSRVLADSYKNEAPGSRDVQNISSFMSFQSHSSNGVVGGDDFSVQSSHPSQYHARTFSLDLKDSFK